MSELEDIVTRPEDWYKPDCISDGIGDTVDFYDIPEDKETFSKEEVLLIAKGFMLDELREIQLAIEILMDNISRLETYGDKLTLNELYDLRYTLDYDKCINNIRHAYETYIDYVEEGANNIWKYVGVSIYDIWNESRDAHELDISIEDYVKYRATRDLYRKINELIKLKEENKNE